ncbi:MAG: EamA family transporter [Microlunatus sp.]
MPTTLHSSRTPCVNSRTARVALAQVCAAGVLWGTSPVAFDLVHDTTPLTSLAVSAHRLAIAAVVLIATAAATRQLRALCHAVRVAPFGIILIGLGVAGYQALWFAAIVQVGVSVATVVSLGLAPILVTCWEAWEQRRRPGVLQLLVVVAAITGLVLVSLSSGEDGSVSADPVVGLLLAAASGVLYAVTTVVSRRIAPRVAPMPMATATTAVGAMVLLPVAALCGPLLATQPAAVLSLVYLGIVTTALAYGLLYAGLRTAPGSAAVVATLLEPVTATVLAVVLLGDTLPALAVVGIVLILVAVGLLRIAPRGEASMHTPSPPPNPSTSR